jgi:hypothetical protein
MSVVPFGDSILPGEANPALVAELERLLSEARSGDLRAIAYGSVRAGNVLGTGWVGSDGTRNPVATVILMLHSRYASALLSNGDE